MRTLFRVLSSLAASSQPVERTSPRDKTHGVKDLLELSESEIIDRLFTLDRPERLYTHQYAMNYIDPHPGEYGDSNGDPEYFLFKVRDKIVQTIAGGLELEGALPVSRSDFEKAIELTTLLSSHSEPVLSGWNTYAIDQFTVGFDSRREEICLAVEAFKWSSGDETLVSNLEEMVASMQKASSLVIA